MIDELVAAIVKGLKNGEPMMLEDLPWPPGARVLILAPHPDDFDSISVTLRHFRDLGNDIRLSVVSFSWSGVEDSFCNPPTVAGKSSLRESEQLASCALFGMPARNVTFLRLAEDSDGDPLENEANFGRLDDHLNAMSPDLVFLPHGNDPNPGHARTFRLLMRHLHETGRSSLVFLFRDPKTVAMESHLYRFFDEDAARWKGAMLRCHASQQQRNLHLRGYGLDERILRLNRQIASAFPGREPYAEVFEIRIPPPGNRCQAPK
jgi:LmbE family N-acetylglucosaminyl deacetylase